MPLKSPKYLEALKILPETLSLFSMSFWNITSSQP